jgi:hypothetical protein
MQAARLRLVFLLLVGAFALVAAAAVASLLALRDPFLAGVVALAGVLGVGASAFTWVVARREPVEAALPEPDADVEIELPAEPAPMRQQQQQQQQQPQPLARPRVRVQSLPVADLPPAYLTAVMNGARARTAALRQQGRLH